MNVPAFEEQLTRMGVTLHSASASERCMEDFGHLVSGKALGRVRVQSAHELRDVVRAANETGVKLTPRGGGNSQSGQSLPRGGYSLDLSAMDRLEPVDEEHQTVCCGGGTTWRAVARHTLGSGMLPRVLPLNLDLSVGGSLSAGVVGPSSHRHGLGAANVDALTVVTGSGELVRCGPFEHEGLFDAVLSGQGRVGVIASAVLQLRPARSHVRTSYLLYDAPGKCLADLSCSASEPRFHHVESYCSAAMQGLRLSPTGRTPLVRWFYGTQVSVEFGDKERAETSLDHLCHREIVHEEVDDIESFIRRYDYRFDTMRQTGAWKGAHPWFEVFLPFEEGERFIEYALSRLPLFFGDGHRMFVIPSKKSPKNLALPKRRSGQSVLFAVLPTEVPRSKVEEAKSVLSELDARASSAGGVRYPSGWVNRAGEDYWQRHLGDRYGIWLDAKKTWDPGCVLESCLMPGSAAEAGA